MSDTRQQLIVVLGLVRDTEGNVLLAHRVDTSIPDAFGKWELVGGRVDFGEEPEAALLREVGEETGLQVAILRQLPKVQTRIWVTKTGEQIQVFLLTYECGIIGGKLNNQGVADEIGEFRFVSPKELATLDTLPNIPEIIKFL